MKKQVYSTIQELKVGLIDNPEDVIMSRETIRFDMTVEDVKYILPLLKLRGHINFISKCVELDDDFIIKNLSVLNLNNIFSNKLIAKNIKIETIEKIIEYKGEVSVNIFRDCALNYDFLMKYKNTMNYSLMIMNPNIDIDTKIQFLQDAETLFKITEIAKLEFSCLLGKYIHEKDYNIIQYYELIQKIFSIYYNETVILSTIIKLDRDSHLIGEIMRIDKELGIFCMSEFIASCHIGYEQEIMIENCNLLDNAVKTYVLRDEFMNKHFDKLNAKDIFKYQLENVSSSELIKKLIYEIDDKDDRILLQKRLIANMKKLCTKPFKTESEYRQAAINLFKIDCKDENKFTKLKTECDNIFVDLGNGQLRVIKPYNFATVGIISYKSFMDNVTAKSDCLYMIMEPNQEKNIDNNNYNELLRKIDDSNYVFVNKQQDTWLCLKSSDGEFKSNEYNIIRDMDICKRAYPDKKILILSKDEYSLLNKEYNKSISHCNIINESINKIKQDIYSRFDNNSSVISKILTRLEKCDYGFVLDKDGEYICVKSRKDKFIRYCLYKFDDLKMYTDNKIEIITKEEYELLNSYSDKKEQGYNLISEISLLYCIISDHNFKANRNVFVDYGNGFAYCISSIDNMAFKVNEAYDINLITKYVETGYYIETITKAIYDDIKLLKSKRNIKIDVVNPNIVIFSNKKIVFKG